MYILLREEDVIDAIEDFDVLDGNQDKVELLNKIRKLLPARQWIPCTPETMPLPNERCILLYSNGKISGGEYDYGNENFIVDFPDNDKAVRVAKWMPDPSEHEEGDRNEHHL
jgi:hypothetical protein